MEMESQRVTGFVPSFNVTKAAARNNNDDDDEERRNGAKEKRRRWMKWKRERDKFCGRSSTRHVTLRDWGLVGYLFRVS